jgi:iron complex outermembrane receptor protein
MKAHRHALLTTSLLVGFTALAPQVGRAAETDKDNDGPLATNGTGQAAAVLAQAAAAAPSTAPKDCPDGSKPVNGECPSASTVKEVVVTGSRFKRTEYNSAAPVQVLSAAQAKSQGVTTTADLLLTSTLVEGNLQQNNELSSTGFIAFGGNGVNTVSLRGLGQNRTLVLIDGERVGPAGTSGTVAAIDLNTIPFSIIDRVEILKDGASSIYGSDAVAGVVNIITKKNLNGGVISAYGDVTQHGGGAKYDINAAWGKTSSHGYFNVSFDYSQQDALRNGQRPALDCASDYLFGGPKGPRIDFQDVNGGNKCFNLFANTLIAGSVALINPVPGVTYPAIAQGNPYGLIAEEQPGFPETFPYGLSKFPLFDNSATLGPTKIYSLVLKGGHDLTDSMSVWGDILLNRRESVQLGFRQFFPFIPFDNPNNNLGALGAPCATDDPATCPVPLNGGQVYGGLLPVTPLRSNADQEVDYLDARGGVKGKIGAFPVIGGWDWDAYASISRSYGRYGEDIIYQDRVNAITESGIACDQSAINISGGEAGGSCSTVPNGINLLSPQALNGQFSPAESKFLFGYQHGTTVYLEQDFEATMQGRLFKLPAGDLKAVLGVSERAYSINDTPGQDMRTQNLWGFTSSGITKGTDVVQEVFGEFDIPVAKNLPFIKAFELQASGRYTDYRSFGGNGTYRIGAVWDVVPSLTLRATHGTSFRAPALYELYLANQTGFLGQLQINPCVNWGNSSNANLRTNCAALGFAPNYVGANSSSATITTGGGKGHLSAETSESTVVGLIFAPTFAPVKISVDYTQLKISNEVAQFGAGNIATQCVEMASLNNAFCSLVTFGTPTGQPEPQILAVQDNYVNISSQTLHAYDLTIDAWKTLWGNKFTFRGTASWQTQALTQVFTGFATVNYANTTFNFGGPEFVSYLNFGWQRGHWSGLWSVNMIGHGSDQDFLGSSSPSQNYNRVVYEKNYVEFSTYHTASLTFDLDTFSIVGGVRNVFDRGAPNVSSSESPIRQGTAALFAYQDGYLGRQFFLNLSKKF